MIFSPIKYIALAVLLSLNIYANSMKTDAQVNIEIFDGLCAQNSDDFANIKHMIKAFGGKELNATLKNSDPVLRKKGGEAYIVPYQKRKYLVSYAHNGGCSITTDQIDHKNLIKLITENYSVKLIDTASDGMQIEKYYRVDKNSSRYNGSVITLIYAKKNVNSTSGTISFISKKTVNNVLGKNDNENIFNENIKNCKNNDAVACNTIGYMYNTATNVKLDYIKAKEFYTKACDAGNAEGCHNLGLLYANGQSVELNYKIAKEFFDKACNKGHEKGCENSKMLVYKIGIAECKSKQKDYMFAINMINENIKKQNTSLIKFYTEEKIRISYKAEKACSTNIVGEEQAKKIHEDMIFDRDNAQKTLEIIKEYTNDKSFKR